MDALGRFEEVMGAPADAVALDEAALCVAAVAQPGLDIDAELARLDRLASECATPTLGGLVGLLFASERFVGNTTDYYDPRNSYLDQVMTRGIGIPITLSVLAMEVGRRIGVPLAGVGMPGHFLLRDQLDAAVFVDPFHHGRLLDAHQCRALFARSMGRQAPWYDGYLEPVSRAAIVERMVANLRLVFQRSHDTTNLRWVLRLRVRCPGATDDDHRELARSLADTN
jgi:regulator of sirC expression with transglutaminase-like and TPR domain